MKKLNRSMIKGTNWALTGLMSLFGFSSCSENDGEAPEYGTPYAEFIVSGKVTDTGNRGLRDIRVVVPRVDHHQRATPGFIPDRTFTSGEVCDTTYTGENGDFEYAYACVPTNDSINVMIKFEDISADPRFETDSTKVTFFSSELQGGDGWYAGRAKKEIRIRLKGKKGE
jgi:putative lipoprotein (rSAM/lipoprotein system)